MGKRDQKGYRLEVGFGGETHEMHFVGPLTARSVKALEINVRLFREMFAEQEARRAERQAHLAAMTAEYGPRNPQPESSPP